MPRIRTIKPELYRHLKLFEAEQACGLPLRLAFTGLLTCADREGRFKWEPRVLKLDVLPFDEVDFAAVLNTLAKTGLILRYCVEEEFYGVIPSWHKHQRINPHEPSSQLPAPPSPIDAPPHPAAMAPCPPPPIERACTHPEPLPKPTLVKADALQIEELSPQPEGLRKESKTPMLRPLPTLSPVTPPLPSPVQMVFEHWKTTFHHSYARLDDKRQHLIQKALRQGYTIGDLCEAITGCALTPYNCGDNQQGERYDGLHIILRDADQIERFMRHCYNPPQPSHNKKLQANALAAERWLQQEVQE